MVAQAVVVATGVCGDGRREVLGFAVGDSEDGAFWTAFLRSLKARGLAGVQLVIADAHLGLRQAIQAVMAAAAMQRCRVHWACMEIMCRLSSCYFRSDALEVAWRSQRMLACNCRCGLGCSCRT